MIQLARSLVFNASMYLSMAVMAVGFLPLAIASREGARLACRTYCRYVIWTARWMVGLKVEVRGTPPTDEVLVAAKHQSFFDILVIFSAMPRPKFIMKRELLFAPLLGQYAWRIGCVPVNRGKRGQAIAKMLSDVARGTADAGQLVIYPQGTRVAPGVKMPYKVGTALLYDQLGQPCVPVATNIGVFWPKRAVLRRSGVAVVEFLPPLPPGLPKDEFLSRLERQVEGRSDALIADARSQV
jgi:1-acyl-sn-glycerol-3-phosphate acyltransferase